MKKNECRKVVHVYRVGRQVNTLMSPKRCQHGLYRCLRDFLAPTFVWYNLKQVSSFFLSRYIEFLRKLFTIIPTTPSWISTLHVYLFLYLCLASQIYFRSFVGPHCIWFDHSLSWGLTGRRPYTRKKYCMLQRRKVYYYLGLFTTWTD